MSIEHKLTYDARMDVEDYVRGFEDRLRREGVAGAVEWWTESRRTVERLFSEGYVAPRLLHGIVDAVTQEDEPSSGGRIFRLKAMTLLGLVLLHPPSWSKNQFVSSADMRLRLTELLDLREEAEGFWREAWEIIRNDFLRGPEPNLGPYKKESAVLAKLGELLKA